MIFEKSSPTVASFTREFHGGTAYFKQKCGHTSEGLFYSSEHAAKVDEKNHAQTTCLNCQRPERLVQNA